MQGIQTLWTLIRFSFQPERGEGTLSEFSSAWQGRKKVLCLNWSGGWAAETAARNIGKRNKGLHVPIETLAEFSGYLVRNLKLYW